jgi:hypothetical protein
MGLGKILKSVFGKPEKYKSPDVTFLEDNASGVTHTIPITISSPPQQIIIKNGDEYLVFNSKDDIPPDLLKEIEHLDDLGTVDSYSVIVDGQRQIYTSYEDIPHEVRKAMKDIIKE